MLWKAIKKEQAAESSTVSCCFCLISKILNLSNLAPSSSLKVLSFYWCCLVKLQYYGLSACLTILYTFQIIKPQLVTLLQNC